MKKCFAILLAVAMTLTMAVTAFAEDAASTPQYTLTVKNQNTHFSKVNYKVYQLFLCNLDKNSVPSYTKDGAKNAALVGTKTVEDIAAMQNDSEELYKFAADISTLDPEEYATLETGTGINVEAGYYLLVPTSLTGKAETADIDNDEMVNGGATVSAPILVAVPGVTKNAAGTYDVTENVEVNAKNSEVSHEKKITDVVSVNGTNDTISTSKDTATAGEGDTIEYTITNTVPQYKADVDPTKVNYFVTDNYDSNLTLVDVVVNGAKGTAVKDVEFIAKDGTTRIVKRVVGGDYFVEEDEEQHQFIVYFNFDSIKDATNVVIKAHFTLNNTATPRTEVVNNSELTYTNNYYVGTNSDSELEDEVKSYTFKFNVYKYDTSKTQNAALSGATFGLYKDEECTKEIAAEVTSGANGIVDFGKLLNAGTYYVKETKAPNGYRVDDKVYKVEIVAGTNDSGEYDGSYTVKVDGDPIGYVVNNGENKIYEASDNIPVLGIGNTPGLSLPGTGGIGTTLFTFGGLALVLVAGVMFIVYTRKQKKQS